MGVSQRAVERRPDVEVMAHGGQSVEQPGAESRLDDHRVRRGEVPGRGGVPARRADRGRDVNATVDQR